MLYVPFLAGAIVAGAFPLRAWLLLTALTLVFLSRPTLQIWWRSLRNGRRDLRLERTLLALLSLAALSVLPLITLNRLYGLIPVGVVALVLLGVNAEQSTRREDRTVAGEILAILGLTLTAPAAHYVIRQQWEPAAFWLWGLCATFFASSVFYVRLRVYASNPRKQVETIRLRRQCGVYHSTLFAALVIYAVTTSVGIFALAAFAPALARAFWLMMRPAPRLNLKRIGVLEIVYSSVFLAFVAMGFTST